tara:strand:+ start:269 stop:637 length:369 start_codon:yes stop_codon:yes gene_type:complete
MNLNDILQTLYNPTEWIFLTKERQLEHPIPLLLMVVVIPMRLAIAFLPFVILYSLFFSATGDIYGQIVTMIFLFIFQFLFSAKSPSARFMMVWGLGFILYLLWKRSNSPAEKYYNQFKAKKQ